METRTDFAKHQTITRLYKFESDEARQQADQWLRERGLPSERPFRMPLVRQALQKAGVSTKPWIPKDAPKGLLDVREIKGNILLNEGINLLWTLACGGTGTPYNNANARIGVGDSDVAASPTQTDLQGTNKSYKGMDSGYPTFGTAQKVTFQSTWGSTEGNFTWREWSCDNGAAAGINLNRRVDSLGTKTTGSWVLQVSITLS